MEINPFLKLPLLVERIVDLARPAHVYLVGGAVRDALLGLPVRDLDFAVASPAIETARRIANELGADFYVLDGEFDAARMILDDDTGQRTVVDLAGFRGKTLHDDLISRDFTINSLGLDFAEMRIIDPCRGAEDLRAKVLRACTSGSIIADPVRAIRAVRLAVQFSLAISPETLSQVRSAADSLPGISLERRRDELVKILQNRDVDTAVSLLQRLGMLHHVLPGLEDMPGVRQWFPHVFDVWEHTLRTVAELECILSALGAVAGDVPGNGLLDGLLSLRLGRFRKKLAAHFSVPTNPDRSRRDLMMLAALYHDVAKPRTASVKAGGITRFPGHEEVGAALVPELVGKLALANAELDRVARIIVGHHRFGALVAAYQRTGVLPSRRDIYRFFLDSGDVAVDLVILALADIRAVYGHTLPENLWSAELDVARQFLENLWERPHESVDPVRLLDGQILQRELGLPAGPLIGELLRAVREAQAVGEVASAEEALILARNLADSTSKR